MNSKMTVAVITLLMAGAVVVAGCPSRSSSSNNGLFSESPSPSPSPYVQVTPIIVTPVSTPGPNDAIAYFEGLLKTMNWAIKQPLTHTINSVGNDVYTGTVARGTTTASVTIETTDNIQDTQTRALDYRTALINLGYNTIADQSTYWTGMNNVGREAWIISDTTDLYDMVFVTT